ncbi:MAG: hypothetical protein AAF514_02695 [Verrucomicrobiota bacterium]
MMEALTPVRCDFILQVLQLFNGATTHGQPRPGSMGIASDGSTNASPRARHQDHPIGQAKTGKSTHDLTLERAQRATGPGSQQVLSATPGPENEGARSPGPSVDTDGARAGTHTHRLNIWNLIDRTSPRFAA